MRDWGTCDESHDYKQEGAVGKSRRRENEKGLTPVCQLLVISYQLSERIVISKHWESLCFCLGVSPLLQKKKESRVKLAPTSTSPYIFIEKTTETQTFMLPRSFRLGACCLTILTLLRQIPML